MMTAIRMPRLIAASAEPDRARCGQVAQSESRRDRGAATEACQHRQAEGGEQDHRRDEADETDDELGCPGFGPAPGTRVRQRQEREQNKGEAGHDGAVELFRGGGSTRQSRNDGHLVIARAGREAAKYVATTARAIATPITTQGRAKAPIT